MGRVLTTGEAAELLGLAASTLENLRVLGGGPTYLKLGRAVRYRAEDLDGWLGTRKRRSTSEVPSAHRI
jgi:excisionase family DNA binding protein